MYGNLCPGGGVAKITGKEGETFTVSHQNIEMSGSLVPLSLCPLTNAFIRSLIRQGTARVYDNEQLMLRGLEQKEIQCGDVVIIRYEGPTGGPGLPEMLTPTRYDNEYELI